MGIFTRVRDIISANINSMLDKAEDPEKLVKLMIREMEDTLVEVKASCAGAMATKKKVQRESEKAAENANAWEQKAELAIEKGRDDLAREALVEKKRYTERVDALESELEQCDGLVGQYQGDISQLEEKLDAAREKQRMLVQRNTHAQHKVRAESEIRKMDTANAMARFDGFEEQIERMETDADLVNLGRKPDLEEEFRRLKGDEDIDKELEALKAKKGGSG
ncbi:MAG: phage shock protein PspA [Candidatus Hydrogenedentes bacterium]|nr:phage shock protein PspA [Candidatus Hydrogenedentota bacterium]